MNHSVIAAPTILFDPIGTTDRLIALIESARLAGAKGIMALGCAEDDHHKPKLDSFLRQLDIPICGGFFPAIIAQNQVFHSGQIVAGFFQNFSSFSVRGLSNQSESYQDQLKAPAMQASEGGTLFIFTDGTSRRTSHFLQDCYGEFGMHFSYMGGGTGKLTPSIGHTVISNQGLLKESASIGILGATTQTGVAHGWKRMAGPYLVTNAVDNALHTLDYQPALAVYSNAIKENTGREITQSNLQDVSMHHPFGVYRVDGELIVRDPVGSEGPSIVCVGEVPSNQLVYILHATEDDLLQATRKATNQLKEHHSISGNDHPVVVFDCISRQRLLKDHFTQEIDILKNLSNSSFGALTLGEIGKDGQKMPEHLNKSIVLGCIGDRRFDAS